MVPRRFLSAAAAMLVLTGLSWEARGTDIYIDPSGSNDLLTFTNAISAANPGDTIFVHGGTYNLNARISISKSGSSGNPINMFAVPGETPILDYSSMSSGLLGSSSGRGMQFNSNADWWHVKGLRIENAKDNGLYVEGDNNLFEQLVLHANADSGAQLSGSASFNTIMNTDSYENYDPHNHGENADGFAAKFENLGPGNVFSGDRSWGNSDDGWDFWGAASGVTVQNSWSFKNGFNIWGDSSYAGDGNGIKLGHDSGTHVLENLLVWGNPANGVDVNGNATQLEPPANVIDHGVQVYNVTAYDNGSKNFQFDEDPTTASPPTNHILRNNISLSGSVTVVAGNTADHNTWNGISVDANDFMSLSDAGATGPRQSDGSLPILDFLRLKSDSNLIDAGVDVGLLYNGTAPDLGAYEFVASSGLIGDYNNDGEINAADYTMWRDAMAGGGSLTNDPTPATVDESDFTYWRSHFGESLGSGAGASSAAVPEPTTIWMMSLAAGLFALDKRRHTGR